LALAENRSVVGKFAWQPVNGGAGRIVGLWWEQGKGTVFWYVGRNCVAGSGVTFW
jgi:hypothetical protein